MLGSVKSNIGHLEAAAGVAGLIKVVLALRHGDAPAHAALRDAESAHPHSIDCRCASRRQPAPWPAADERVIAGVSSFGFGGTNAHLVVGRRPNRRRARKRERAAHLVVLSARSREALERQMARVREQLSAANELATADVCHTLRAAASASRIASPRWRRIVTRSSRRWLNRSTRTSPTRLRRKDAGGSVHGSRGCSRGRDRSSPGWPAGSPRHTPSFRRDLVDFTSAVDAHLDLDLLATILPPKGAEAAAREKLDETIYTQTSLFCVEMRLRGCSRHSACSPTFCSATASASSSPLASRACSRSKTPYGSSANARG